MNSILQIVFVMFLWAICFPLIAAGLSYAPHLTFATLRAVLAGGALLVLAVALRRRMPSDWQIWAQLTVVGLGATTLGFLGMFHAAEYISPGMATVITNTQPLMAAVLAHFFLNERTGLLGKSGLFLGFLGIVLITLPQFRSATGGSYAIGIAYIVLAAFGITVSNVLIRRLANSVDALVAMGWQLLLGSVPLAVAAALTEKPWDINWTPTFVFSLVSLSALGTALAYWLWFTVLRHVELNRANSFSFLVPIFGLAMGAGLYGERLSWLAIAGVGLALVGIALVNRGQAVERVD